MSFKKFESNSSNETPNVTVGIENYGLKDGTIWALKLVLYEIIPSFSHVRVRLFT
jgi:hypothetical protein